jgi:hypothetical protein
MDVYAMAVVVYELLSGSHPFVGPDVTSTFARALELVPPPLSTQRGDLPPGLDAVLARGMHKRRDARFANAAEFARALRAVCPKTDEAVVAELAEQLQADFHGQMPEELGLQRLEARELAWRTAKAEEPTPDQALGMDTEVDVTGPGLLDRTLQNEIRPSMLARARRSTPVAASGGGLSRSLTVAAVAAVIGAAVALAAWFGVMGSGDRDQLVVISRESSSGQLPSVVAPPPAPPPPPQPVEQLAPEPAVPPATIQPAPRAPSAVVPAAPDPVALTRTFSRRQAQVTRCFNEHAQTQETAGVSLHFRVDQSGEVGEATLRPDTLSSTPLGRCLLEIARRTKFGPLTRGVSFQIPLSVQKL